MDPIRAAQYVRMSTEHQRYSIPFQSHANETYARSRGYEIIRTYADAGVSGLTLRKREALQRLLADVVSGEADFSVVLVYDVSRWGRFQDPDESAHYEFLCREAGVRIEYCAEPFENDGSMASILVKHLKRAMAAEYLRELSSRIRRTKLRLAQEGYWTGGPCTYGYRRCAIAPDGSRLGVMEFGQRKALQGYRTGLVAGPAQEVETVRRIFSLFVVHGLAMRSIAKLLNAEGVPATGGRPWTEERIRNLLGDEKVIGTLVVGRRSSMLKVNTLNPRATWRRVRGACPVLVNRQMFDVAQANIRRHWRTGSDEDLIEELRGVLARHGRLSFQIIQHDPAAHSPGAYSRRFGTLSEAYARAGYKRTRQQELAAERVYVHKPHLSRDYPPHPTDEVLLQELRALFREKGRLSIRLIQEAEGMHADGIYRRRFGSLGRAYALVGYVPTAAQQQRFKTGV